MIRLHINSQIHGTPYLDFNSQLEVDQYIADIGDQWGRQQEEIVIVKHEVQDEQGNVVEPQITETLPQQVVFTQEDVTAQVAQEAINAEALAYLASTDFLIIREMDSGVACPAEIKSLRQAARLRIVR